LDSLEHKDAGSYICSVTYNNITRFVNHRQICIKSELLIIDYRY